MRCLTLLSTVLILVTALPAQGGYRRPPEPIAAILEAEPPPSVSASPDGRYLLFTHRESMPSIEVMARPYLKLAGLRIDPATRGRKLSTRIRRLSVMNVASGETQDIEVPGAGHLSGFTWNRDGRRFAFTNTRLDRIDLWVGDVASATAQRFGNVRLSGFFGSSVRWMPDGQTLLCHLVAKEKPAPERPLAPTGPNTQESAGIKAPVRTYQDLLQNGHDESVFEHLGASQLARLDLSTGKVTQIGKPGLHTSASPSPDGRFLLVTTIHRPFSFLSTWWSFPRRVAVWTTEGAVVREIVDQPLAEGVPIGGVLTGPRSVAWITSLPATLRWNEALDGGDPKAKVDHRDKVMTAVMPEGEPVEWFRSEFRMRGMQYAQGGDLALASTYDRDTRTQRTWRLDPRDFGVAPEKVRERSSQDAYSDPGRPMMSQDQNGRRVMRRDGPRMFLTGRGSSPEGDRPFLDAWNPTSGETKRLFRCAESVYEQVIDLMADDGSAILVRKQSKTDPPNYYRYDLKSGEKKQLTRFTDPALEFTRKIKKRLVTYEREDGIPLSATLYLPPDYVEGERRPLLVWAYPREFNSKKNAGQVRGSPHRYTRLGGSSHLFLLLQGYVIMDGATMPVVGPVQTANDTFVDQLVASANAAIDAAVEAGVADRDRAAIAGHSYGAFMTANLLAHSDLFKAGIARSGAYNRTLTPFGFQNERRTFWESPTTYFGMSPFMHAQKINEPLLMIHGEDDNNSGTFPVQSKRMYHAVKGNGGHARLVMLPHESHGYRAKESVMHCLAEMVDWMNAHVKNAASGN